MKEMSTGEAHSIPNLIAPVSNHKLEFGSLPHQVSIFMHLFSLFFLFCFVTTEPAAAIYSLFIYLRYVGMKINELLDILIIN